MGKFVKVYRRAAYTAVISKRHATWAESKTTTLVLSLKLLYLKANLNLIFEEFCRKSRLVTSR
jgi:hypothetical protein